MTTAPRRRGRALILLAGLFACLLLTGAADAQAAPLAHTAVELAGPVDARLASFLDSPGCGSIFLVSNLCRETFGTVNDVIHGNFVKAAGDALGGNGTTAEHLFHGAKDAAKCLSDPLDCLANAVADAAGAAFRWLWRNIDTATSIDLVPLFHPFASGGQSLMDVTIEIAALVGLALFFVQIVMSALRAEPGGVGRAARGLVSAYVGSIVAILSIPLLDAAITQVCDGIVKTVTGKDLSGFGHTLAGAMSLSGLAGAGLPVALILIGLAIIVAAVIIWAAMMVRKMLVVVAAIFAPIAFSGATADMTKNWMRRWIEVTLALLFSKLILVIIMTVGFMMMDGYSQHGGVTNTLTNVCIGVLLLALGGFAPLMAIKMVHFAGEGLQYMHAQAVSARSTAQSVAATPQKVQGLAARFGNGRNGNGNGNGQQKPGDDGAAGMRQQRNPLPTDKPGGGQINPAANGTPAGGSPAVGAEAARKAANAPRQTAARIGAAADQMRPPPTDTRAPKTR